MNQTTESKTEKIGFFEKRRRAAWRAGVASGMDPAVAAMRARLHLAARTDSPIIFGPWLSEVGYEILYWIPFLHWAVKEYEIDPERVCIISRGGVSDWYGRLANRYEDIFKLMSPAKFKELNDARYVQTGVQKHVLVSDFDRLVLEKLGYANGILVHPEIMYNLFNGYWSGTDAFSKYTDHIIYHLMKPPSHPVAKKLPDDFVAVKFYSRPSLVMNDDSRRTIDQYTLALAEAGPVVVLDTGLAADDHGDFAPPSHPNIISAREWMSPEDNLVTQSAIVARAKEVHCTYGGFAYLPLLYGVPAESFYSVDKHFMKIHGRAAYWLAAKTRTALSVTHLSSAARLADSSEQLRRQRAATAAAAGRASQLELTLNEQKSNQLNERATLSAKLREEREKRNAERKRIASLVMNLNVVRADAEEKTIADSKKLDQERRKIEALTKSLQAAVGEKDNLFAERRRANAKIAAMRGELAMIGALRPPDTASLAQAWEGSASKFRTGASAPAPAFRDVREFRALTANSHAARALLANIRIAENDIDDLRDALRAAAAACAAYPGDEFFWRFAALCAQSLAGALRSQPSSPSVPELISAAALSGEGLAPQRSLVEEILRNGEAITATDLCYSALIWRRDAGFHALAAEALLAQDRTSAALLHLAAGVASQSDEAVLKESTVARALSVAIDRGANADDLLEGFEEAVAHCGGADRLTSVYIKSASDSEASAFARRLLQRARRESIEPRAESPLFDLPLVLISQVQRSGGTLLAQLLDHHPNLLTHPHELHIGYPNKWDWPKIDMKDGPEIWLERLFERTIAKFLAKEGYTKSDGNSFALREKKAFPFSLPVLVSEFDRHARAAKSPRECVAAYLSAYFQAWQVTHPLGEKKWFAGFCPRMLLHEESISGFFGDYPDGRLIACIRDPFSWYASSMRHDEEYKDIEHAIELWRQSAEAALRQLDARPNSTYLITYAALVENSREVMAGVADFLGVPLTENMLEPTYAGERILPNSSYDINQYGIHRMSIDAGDRLNNEQQNFITRAAGELYNRAVDVERRRKAQIGDQQDAGARTSAIDLR